MPSAAAKLNAAANIHHNLPITISFSRILLSCPPFREFHVMDRLAPPCQPAFAKIASCAVNPPDRKSKICSAEIAGCAVNPPQLTSPLRVSPLRTYPRLFAPIRQPKNAPSSPKTSNNSMRKNPQEVIQTTSENKKTCLPDSDFRGKEKNRHYSLGPFG